MAYVPKIIEDLRLRFGLDAVFPVPEGGWFLPTWRSDRGRYEAPTEQLSANQGGVPTDVFSTNPGSAGYYVLAQPDHALGALHILKCDEIYTFIEGDPVELCQIAPDGRGSFVTLGQAGGMSHGVVPGQTLHAVQSTGGETGYSVLHLVAIPGFMEEDASIPSREELLSRFPEQAKLIERFTRDMSSPPASNLEIPVSAHPDSEA